MIEIKNINVFGFEAAIRGMRNPYMSHEKSDSVHCEDIYPSCSNCPIFKDFGKGHSYCISNVSSNTGKIVIGKNDLELCKKLIKGGSEHRKFLRMIHVQADVLAPRYWWAEADKYKYVEANSSSTIHLITKRELTLDDFSFNEYVPSTTAEKIVEKLNTWIKDYNHMKDSFVAKEKELLFSAIKQILPESYNQLRTIDTNYETLLNIYMQRKNHRLSEWIVFCGWCLTLPYMSEFLEVVE